MHWSDKLENPFAVRVTPKASSNRITVDLQDDGSTVVRIYVTAVPENGKANRAVIKLLAKEMGVPQSSLSVTKGIRARDKLIMVQN